MDTRARSKFFIVCILLFAFFSLCPIVSADVFATVSPNISQGATVFIGEQGLNLQPAIDGFSAKAGYTPASVGWWEATSNPDTKAPDRIYTLTTPTNTLIAPATFVNFYGAWYPVDLTSGHANTSLGALFIVADPALDLGIWDFSTGSDKSGLTVNRGDYLGFRVVTNMASVLNATYRSPVYNSTLDGYIDIRVTNETGTVYTALFNSSGQANTLLQQNISTSSWIWGKVSSAPFNWSTAATNSDGQYLYLPGTYTVVAESLLNNMMANYLSSGTAYVGKTVSSPHTVTLLPGPPIASFTANVTSGSAPLAVQFNDTSTGAPTKWNWSFGDGNQSVIQNPVFVYTILGNYSISLNVTNAGGFNKTVKMQFIQVAETPNYQITGPTTITALGVYTLQNDITTTTSPCIQISSADVIFDGMGHIVQGTDMWARTGIQAQNSNITVRNLTVTIWDYGINFGSASNGRIENVTSTSNGHYGYYLGASHGVTVVGSRVTGSDIGIRVSSSPGVRIDRTQVSGGSTEIYLEGSSNFVTINGTQISGSSSNGMAVESSSGTTVNASRISSNPYGIYLTSANGLNLTNSYLLDNTRGINLINAGQHTVYNNHFRNTNNVVLDSGSSVGNTWNRTLTAGPNIIGGSFIGGNYWTQPDNLGFSQIHNDTDNNGICEDPYPLPGGTDLLPLHNYTSRSPITSFNANVTSGMVPFTVQFNDTTSNTPMAWNWSFGDGQFSPLQNPSHTYTVPGIYTIALKSENLYGNSTLQRTGYITARLLGDVNSNGAVDIGDVAGFAYMGVGLTSPVLSVADFNHNAEIDIGDAVKISYYFVGRIGAL